MGYPKNPETIIVQNEFYPRGLREIDVWNYYEKVKPRILKETIGRDIILFIATDVNKIIVKRKGKERPYIQLTPSNYDDVITGRTLSIHSVMRKTEDFGIIDIDTEDFRDAKDAVVNVYNVMTKAPFVNSVSIRFSGKSSFHIVLHYKRKLRVEPAKQLIEDFLRENNMQNYYTISNRKTRDIPNLDLYRNVYNAGFITLFSLSVSGLICMEVPIRYIRSFSKEQAKIRL